MANLIDLTLSDLVNKVKSKEISSKEITNNKQNENSNETENNDENEDEYDITVRLDEYTRNNVENLMNQRITFRDMLNGQIRQVPISSVAKIKKSSTYSSVKRVDLKRTISLQSNIIEGYNANEVVAEISLTSSLTSAYDTDKLSCVNAIAIPSPSTSGA